MDIRALLMMNDGVGDTFAVDGVLWIVDVANGVIDGVIVGCKVGLGEMVGRGIDRFG